MRTRIELTASLCRSVSEPNPLREQASVHQRRNESLTCTCVWSEMFCELVVHSSENQEALLIPLINHPTDVRVLSCRFQQSGGAAGHQGEGVSPRIFTAVSGAGEDVVYPVAWRSNLRSFITSFRDVCSVATTTEQDRACFTRLSGRRDASMACSSSCDIFSMENKHGIDSPPGKIRATLPG